jgi:hypothetical protein
MGRPAPFGRVTLYRAAKLAARPSRRAEFGGVSAHAGNDRCRAARSALTAWSQCVEIGRSANVLCGWAGASLAVAPWPCRIAGPGIGGPSRNVACARSITGAASARRKLACPTSSGPAPPQPVSPRRHPRGRAARRLGCCATLAVETLSYRHTVVLDRSAIAALAHRRPLRPSPPVVVRTMWQATPGRQPADGGSFTALRPPSRSQASLRACLRRPPATMSRTPAGDRPSPQQRKDQSHGYHRISHETRRRPLRGRA